MEYKLTNNNYGSVSLEIKNSSFFRNYYYINDTNNKNINNTNITENANNSYAFIYQNNFEISFTGLVNGSRRYSKNTLNYSIFITIFCIIEMYLSTDFVKFVSNYDQMALNTDIYNIILYNIFVSL